MSEMFGRKQRKLTMAEVEAIRASYKRCRECGAYISAKSESGLCWPCLDEPKATTRVVTFDRPVPRPTTIPSPIRIVAGK